MSDCIITIKIGDKEIRLDPGANISKEDNNALAKTMSSDKLRELYNQLKEEITLDPVLKSQDTDLIQAGKEYYQSLISENKEKVGDGFLTILKVINLEKDPQKQKELSAYASSLDPKEVLVHGNFKIDPQDSYKSSPYSQQQIRKLVFKNQGDKVQLFDDLSKLPGMESLKISIAYATQWNGEQLDRVKGAYISPDNIVQIVLPYLKEGYHKIGAPEKVTKVTEKNIGNLAKSQVQEVAIHELMHAVYSELYRSDPNFKKQIDTIHTMLLEKQPEMYQKYKDPHEFIASIFNDVSLQNSLSKIPLAINNELTLFDSFVNVLANKEGISKPNLLREFIGTLGTSLPNVDVKEKVDYTSASEATLDDKNVFYIGGMTANDEEENASPNDQTDTYYGNNRKAFYANQRFNNKWNRKTADGSFVRDSYYKPTINDPTPERLDILKADDVVLVPWLDYVKATKVDGVHIPGRWQEVGIVIGKDGQALKGKTGKPIIANIIRDEKGNIQKTKEGYTIEERTQGFPIMYSNINKRQIVVAKTNLKVSDEFNAVTGKNAKYNTVSFPYELIRGVRQLDRSYFDHNADYDKQFIDAKAELTKVEAALAKIGPRSAPTESERLFDEQQFFTNRVKQLTDNVQKASDIKEDIKNTYKRYAFSYEEDGKTYTNVAKESYIAAGYTKANIENRIFPDKEPLFLLNKSKFKTKDGNDGWYTQPNYKVFDIMWDEDNTEKGLSKNFAMLSEEMSTAVAKGDLVRAKSAVTFDVSDKEKETAKLNRWFTVIKRVGNGVLCATKDGKGYIVPFNMINAYAKNKSTSDYFKMIEACKQQVNDFNDDAFIKVNGKTKYSPEINSKRLNGTPTIKTDNNGDPLETEEESTKRFDNNLDFIKKHIQPGESFVRISERYTNVAGKVIDYPLNGLVLAKTNDALVVFVQYKDNSPDGYKIKTIRFDSKLGPNSGTELTHFMENTAHIRRAYDEFEAERGQYEINKKTANFEEREGGGYTMLNDPRDNPHNVRQQYDFYQGSSTDGRIDGKLLQRLKESGGIIDIKDPKFDKKTDYGTRIPIYRKVVRVTDDGLVVVASRANKDYTFKNGYKREAGTYYATYVRPENIARIGLNIGKVSKNEETQEYHSDSNEELLNRRKWLFERSKADRDFNNFTFAKTAESIRSLNNKPINKEQDYWRYVPLTNKILEPLTKAQRELNVKEGRAADFDNRPTIYLDKNFKEVASIDKAAYVQATMHKNSEELYYINRGLMTKSKFISPKLAIMDTQFGKRFRPEVLEKIQPGDWITTMSNNGEPWSAVIERVEGGNIYTLNTDFTTSQVSPNKVTAIRMSYRNDMMSGFTRTDNLIKKLKEIAQTGDAIKAIKQARADKQSGTTEAPFSLEAQYKSPKSSLRALRTVGNRLQELNPEVQLNYVDNYDLQELQKTTNYDYSRSRAFVLQGQVYINTDKASISDQVHEYAHLFLNSLKYENPKMYNAIIGVTRNHSLYNDIAIDYSHLEGSDLNEEAFVTILGEYLHNKLLSVDQKNMNDNQSLILDFAKYTKDKLTQALNKTVESIYDVDHKDILQMSWEDVINLVGDHIMNNKITDVYEQFPLKDTQDIDLIRSELEKKGYLTQQC